MCVCVWASRLCGYWTGDRAAYTILYTCTAYLCLCRQDPFFSNMSDIFQNYVIFPACFLKPKSWMQTVPNASATVQLCTAETANRLRGQHKSSLHFSAARRASHCHIFFLNWMILFFSSHQNRAEPNPLSINTRCQLNVSQGKLSDWRLYGTLGFDAGVLDAGQTHLPPGRFSTDELDAWQRGPRKCPSLCSEPTAVPDRSSHTGHLLGHHSWPRQLTQGRWNPCEMTLSSPCSKGSDYQRLAA